MEFKDNLKLLRTQKGLTQAQLAEKLYVSRSTVAKWENGLGLPTPESMAAIEALFEISAQALSTKDPEAVIADKNQKLQLWKEIASCSAILVFVSITLFLAFSIHNGTYGFTPDMAAGVYADRDSMDLGNYRFYYYTSEGDWDDGRRWSDLKGWKLIKKHFWGCTVAYDDVTAQVITKNNYVVGRLYSLKVKDGYYNLINKDSRHKYDRETGITTWDIPIELICATSVTIRKQEYQLENGFCFFTAEPVERFQIEGQWYDVIE